jgi:ParB/RepB/Spo0J family partition protein
MSEQRAIELGILEAEPIKPRFELVGLINFKDRLLVGRTAKPDLVQSIILHGVLQPVILVERNLEYHVIDGLGRIAAALKVLEDHPERTHIPAMVYPEGTPQELITLTTNNQRSYNAVAEALAIKEVLAKGLSLAEVTAITRIPESRVKRRVRLLTLPERLWEAVCANTIRIAVAEQIARLGPAEQALAVSRFIEQGSLKHSDIHDIQTQAKLKSVTTAFDGLGEMLNSPNNEQSNSFYTILMELETLIERIREYDDCFADILTTQLDNEREALA